MHFNDDVFRYIETGCEHILTLQRFKSQPFFNHGPLQLLEPVDIIDITYRFPLPASRLWHIRQMDPVPATLKLRVHEYYAFCLWFP